MIVGASLLAKNVNDNACLLSERGAYEFFARKLAPTGMRNLTVLNCRQAVYSIAPNTDLPQHLCNILQ